MVVVTVALQFAKTYLSVHDYIQYKEVIIRFQIILF